jgi:acyl-CoA synthetase (AMP-forming)/AMP-acid ligase II/GNAT superfamily N-acetyltransferase
MTSKETRNLSGHGASRNFAQVISERAKDMPDQIAVIQSEQSLTFSQLDDLVNRCCNFLQGRGLTQNTVCAISFKDQLTLLIVWLATARLHSTSVSLNPSSTPSQLQDAIQLCRATKLVADHTLDTSEISFSRVSMSDIRNTEPISDECSTRSNCRHDILHIGSGSTGKSKAIAIPFGGIDLQNQLIANSYDFKQGTVFISFVNLSFVSGLRIGLAALSAGGAMYVPGTGRRNIVEEFDRCGIDRVYTTVVHTEQLLGLLAQQNRRLGDHIDYRIGSSVVTDDLVRRVKQRISENVSIGYGTNEVGSVTVLPRAWQARPPGSVGSVIPGVNLEVVDEDGKAVPLNQPGEIRLQAPGMFSEYLGDRDATDQALKNGWFHPGDAALLTSEGHLILLGRTDQMMIWAGVNMYPAEIERVMGEHPNITDVAVMAISHSVAQDIPVCCVVLDESASIAEVDLMGFARRELGDRAPAQIHVLDRIPRNELGKVDRSALRRLVPDPEQGPRSTGPVLKGQEKRLVVRPARAEDLSEILEMVRQLSAFHDDTATLTIDKLRTILFGSPPWMFGIVAQANGGLLGYAALAPRVKLETGERGFHLNHLFVKQDFRRKGVGRALLNAIDQAAKMNSCSFITVGINERNETARKVYLKNGFVRDPIPGLYFRKKW